MKTASLKELKMEVSALSHSTLVELCTRLIKYKKENKELLSYLLFEANDENNYIVEVKSLIDKEFENLNRSNYFFAKKTIRKAIRTTNKFVKYSGIKQTEVELLIYLCIKIKNCGVNFDSNKALTNLYNRLLKRITKAIDTMHEDLQYDYNLDIQTNL